MAQIKGEGNTVTGNEMQTIARVKQNEINMGSFTEKEKRVATFSIENTGDHPLVISGTSTTCGCASVSYDKLPVRTGDSLRVEITMSPKEKGFFSKTITVECNTDKTISLYIKGQVK